MDFFKSTNCAKILALILLVLLIATTCKAQTTNKKPTAKDDVIELGENGIVQLNALTNDTDEDLDILRISSFTFLNKSYSIAANTGKIIKMWDTGILSVHSNGSIQFYPRECFNGSKELHVVYNATDGHGGNSKARIVIRYYDSFEIVQEDTQYCVYDNGLQMYFPLIRARKLGIMHYYYDMGLKYLIEIPRKQWLLFYNRKIKCK